jgi:hypothetical protein
LGLAEGDGGGDATRKSGCMALEGARKDKSDARLNRCAREKSSEVGALEGATARWCSSVGSDNRVVNVRVRSTSRTCMKTKKKKISARTLSTETPTAISWVEI